METNMPDEKTDKPTLVPPKPAPVAEKPQEKPAEKIDPRDVPPTPPPFELRATDFTRWQHEDRDYKVKLSEFQARQALKTAHPELKGVSW
jgi:hypothetical protein